MSATVFQSPDLPEPLTINAVVTEDNAVSVRVRAGEADDKALLEGILTLIAQGEGWLNRNGRVIPFYMTRREGMLQIWLDGRTYEFTAARPGDRRSREGKAAGPAERWIKSPMPGTILKIPVQPGDVVTTDQPLLIMESMKMEMTISASHPAMVRQVLCAEGTRVEMGTTLIELDPLPEAPSLPGGNAHERS